MTSERPVNPFSEFKSEIHMAEIHARGRMQGTLRKAAKKLLDLGLFPTEQVSGEEGVSQAHILHLGQLDEDQIRGIYVDPDGEISLLKRNSDFDIDVVDKRLVSDVHYFKYSKRALLRMSLIYKESQASQKVSS